MLPPLSSAADLRSNFEYHRFQYSLEMRAEDGTPSFRYASAWDGAPSFRYAPAAVLGGGFQK